MGREDWEKKLKSHKESVPLSDLKIAGHVFEQQVTEGKVLMEIKINVKYFQQIYHDSFVELTCYKNILIKIIS